MLLVVSVIIAAVATDRRRATTITAAQLSELVRDIAGGDTARVTWPR